MTESSGRVFAIVPAAGKSRRMGSHKLLLPWKSGQVIDSVLDAWTRSRVDKVIVVCRSADRELQAVCETWPVEVVCPEEDPPDMKASLLHGLSWIETNVKPGSHDSWITAPADLPKLRTDVIDEVAAARHTEPVVIARFAGHASHPVLLAWSLVREFRDRGPEESLKQLIERHSRHYVDFDTNRYAADIDTPEDYRNLNHAE